jgi:hypothetical protein
MAALLVPPSPLRCVVGRIRTGDRGNAGLRFRHPATDRPLGVGANGGICHDPVDRVLQRLRTQRGRVKAKQQNLVKARAVARQFCRGVHRSGNDRIGTEMQILGGDHRTFLITLKTDKLIIDLRTHLDPRIFVVGTTPVWQQAARRNGGPREQQTPAQWIEPGALTSLRTGFVLGCFGVSHSDCSLPSILVAETDEPVGRTKDWAVGSHPSRRQGDI